MLKELYFSQNRLSSLPPGIGRLANLTHLDLGDNRLSSLSPEVRHLEKLQTLHLDGNPLPAELLAAHERGMDALRVFLRDLSKTEEVEAQYEA